MARTVLAVAGILTALLLFTMGPVHADRLGGAYRGPFEDDTQPKEGTETEMTPDAAAGDTAPEKEKPKDDTGGGMGTDEPPPSSGDDDDDATPPPSNDTPGMEGGGGGGNTAKPPPGSGNPGGATGGIGPGGGGGTSPGGRVAQREILAYWPFWFEHNKEWLLSAHLKRAAAASAIPTDSSTFYFSAAGDTRVVTPVSKDQKERVVFTFLVDAARNGETAWIRDAAVIAMGKLGIPEVVPFLVERLQKDKDADVREDALLALGLTRQADAYDPLIDALGDYRFKAYAALGLGLLGEKAAVAPLLKEYRSLVNQRDETTAACLAIAIGALADETAVNALAEPLKKPGNDTLKVFICQALGRIPCDDSEKWLLRVLNGKNNAVKAAAVLSLSEFKDKQVFSALSSGKTFSASRMANVYSQVALARFASGLPEKDKMRGAVVAQLRKSAEKPQKDMYVAMYATLGLAMMGDTSCSQFFLENLEVDNTKLQVENRTAMAIALGFLGDRQALSLLRANGSKGEPDMQGYAALALGILGEVDAKDVVRKELLDVRGKAVVQRSACWALGLLGDRSDIDLLIRALQFEGAEKHTVRGAAAIAIGLIGDASAVDKLMKVAKRDRNTSNQAFAIAALGCLIDKDAVPRLPQLFMNTHYREIKNVDVIRDAMRNL
jgi:HEAT repeat protein